MNQEEQDKIYQLIQTEDINNWELAYQLSVGLIEEDESKILFKKLLNKLYNDFEYKFLTERNMLGVRVLTNFQVTNLMFKIKQFKQTKNMNN